MTGDAHEFATFKVYFKGDMGGAMSACRGWADGVNAMRGVRKLTHVSLRGANGLNMQYFDAEIVEMAQSLSDEAKALLHRP